MKPMRKLLGLALVLIVAVGGMAAPACPRPMQACTERPQCRRRPLGHAVARTARPAAEAADTLARIAAGGPFEHDAGRRGVRQLRGPAAEPAARLLPRVHGGNARRTHARRPPHHHRWHTARRSTTTPPITTAAFAASRCRDERARQHGWTSPARCSVACTRSTAAASTRLPPRPRRAELALCRIDLAGCRDKAALLRRLAFALPLPADFGDNWDALADCLRDPAWQPAWGHVLLFDQLRRTARGRAGHVRHPAGRAR